jgi:hypothetical protein
MRKLIWTVWLGVVAFTWAGAPGPGAPDATSLLIVEPTFHDPQVLVATSMPPQFEVVFVREMPTTGWDLSVDSVDVDEESGRIVAKLTEIAPTGMSAQVITSTNCRVPLGGLTRGVYSLELWLRRGVGRPHVLTQALVVRAR